MVYIVYIIYAYIVCILYLVYKDIFYIVYIVSMIYDMIYCNVMSCNAIQDNMT